MTSTTEITTGEQPAKGRSPGRPRSERAEKAILEATLDLLAEEAGVAGVTIEAVAARAGVGKTTIYRRWPNKEKLIIDALASTKASLPPLTGGSVRDDLVAQAQAVRPGNDPRGDCLWNIIGGASKHPELARQFEAEVIEPRRERMRGLFRRGIETGEIDPGVDIEVAVSMIVGAISMRTRNYLDRSLPADFHERVVDTALRGLSPR
jgi:AcrR family transcriptional regulator